jgi:hypothetical protein
MPNRRALYWITEPGQPERRYETKPAEQLILSVFDRTRSSTFARVLRPRVAQRWHAGRSA